MQPNMINVNDKDYGNVTNNIKFGLKEIKWNINNKNMDWRIMRWKMNNEVNNVTVTTDACHAQRSYLTEVWFRFA